MTDQQIMEANLARMLANFEYDESLPAVETEYLPPADGMQAEKPVLQHAELEILFSCGKLLPPELRATLPALPQPALLADLTALLRFAVADYPRIAGGGNTPESWMPAHAFFLAGAMQADGGLELLLGFLENAEELLDTYFGDLLSEACWWSIYQYLPQGTDRCLEFLKRSGICGLAKNMVVQALFYTAYARPEPDTTLLQRMTDLAQEYAARSKETGFADAMIGTDLALQLIEEEDAAAQSAAKALFDAGLVRHAIAGDYEQVLADRGRHNDEYTTLTVQSLDDIYDIIESFDDGEDIDALDDSEEDDDDDRWMPDEMLYNDPGQPLYNPQLPIVKEEKTGRNEPCPCGSGKKYKKCCLGKA